MDNMNELFLHFLKDMYYAEQQTVRTFPQMLAAAQSQALKQAFEQQAKAARDHVALLEKVFAAIDAAARRRNVRRTARDGEGNRGSAEGDRARRDPCRTPA